MANELRKSFNPAAPSQQKMVTFFRAVAGGDIAAVEKFLDKYPAAINAGIDVQGNGGTTALMYDAGTRGRADTAAVLLERGATVEKKDDGGCTGLMWAAAHSSKDMVALLLENGADINAKDAFGNRANIYAAEGKRWSTMRFLRAKGIAGRANLTSMTTLSSMVDAAKKGDTATVTKLIDKHGAAIINNRNIHGWTPLSWAAQAGQKDMVELLLDRGADIDIVDGYSMTALIHAAVDKHKDIVELLLKRGASTKGKDHTEGMTALMWAVGGGDRRHDEDEIRDIVKLLLESGANTAEKDYSGRTVLTVARNHDHPETVTLLEEWEEKKKQRILAEKKKRSDNRHAKWLRDTDFSGGLKKPIPAPRPFKILTRKV